ncbi:MULTISPECIES: hypothetical protein [unclassified Variovorax]|uniref:hypothetical protein n=1 Tax=unclassified Variovorax TaxID=663243 RepID=UPI001BD31C43|nr:MULTISPECIES: hypothetical protein [unclassified Variovorax]
MASRVLVLDTSVLCCWLRVPGKDTAGPAADLWDHARIDALLKAEEAQGSTFVLPIATLIETGNHIAQCTGDRFALASKLGQHLAAAADSKSPWAAFSEQSVLWDTDALRSLANDWPPLAAASMSIGDATIKAVAEYYATARFHVQILTADEGLKAYEPTKPIVQPRRRV